MDGLLGVFQKGGLPDFNNKKMVNIDFKKIKSVPFFWPGTVQIDRVNSGEIRTLFQFRKQYRKMDIPYLFGGGWNKLFLSGSGINYFLE